MKELIQEALKAGWNDRLFHYYQLEVDANAVRPQDENSKEWKEIIAKLEALTTPKPVVTPKAKQNDQTGSIRD